jgi:hypothetical protein
MGREVMKTYRTAEEARLGGEEFRRRMIEALRWNPWMPGSRPRKPSTELERRHFWPDCEIIGCYYCLWWDICWQLADFGIQVKGPVQW